MRYIKYVLILAAGIGYADFLSDGSMGQNILFAQTLETPVWLSDTTYDDYGLQDRVLLPWTPVETDGDKTFRVWGRSFVWSEAGILPARICSQNVDLMSTPLRLVLTVGGRDYDVPLSHLTIVDHRQSRITFVAEGEINEVAVRAEMWLEYDGFLWIQLLVNDSRANRNIDGLHIVATFPAAEVPLYQTFSAPHAGWIGNNPVPIPWMADAAGNIVNFYHWLGNEDRGLGFTFTSLENCCPADEDNFATIVPGGTLTNYRINLVEKPTTMRPWRFQCGIQATPIKPLPPDYHAMMASDVCYLPFSPVQQMPENFDMVTVWPEPSTTIQLGLNNPYHVDAGQMRDVVAYWHGKGVGINTVAACPQRMCDYDDWFNTYFTDWTTVPESSMDWCGHLNYQNCGKSYTLRKWLFYGWAIENAQKFQTEGIYWDGWQAGQVACSNAQHGCGWTDGQGIRHPTVPVLEGREFNQRICMFLEDHVRSPYYLPDTAPDRTGFPPYHLWIHSWQFVPSVMGFATEWLTGEFAAYTGIGMLNPDGTYGQCLGLGLMRARCLSTNWGLPNYFHAVMWEHEENSPDKQTLQAYAWFLPHGTPISGVEYMNHRVVKEITGILMNFEARKCTFTPGWRPNPHVEIETPKNREVMVATWEHPDKKRVLMVVSNLNVTQTRDVQLRWKGFFRPQFKNARTGETIPAADPITVTLGPESFILISAEAMGLSGDTDYLIVGYQNSELLRYDEQGRYVGKLTPDGAVAGGTSLTVDPLGRIYYGNANGVLSRFRPDGIWDYWYQQRPAGQFYGIVAGIDAVFASDATENLIWKYNPSQSAGGGVVLDAGPYLISNPQGMCRDAAGRIYVANRGNGNILRWKADATFDWEVVGAGGAPNCVDVAIDAEGYLWVLRVEAEKTSYLIKFTCDGVWAGVICYLDAATNIRYPNHVYFAPDGRMIVSAASGVHVYDAGAGTWSTFIGLGNGGLKAPYGIVRMDDIGAPIPGDANRDGRVDVGDLGILATNYGGTNKIWSEGDFNGDNKVDVGDLGILAANYGQGLNAARDSKTPDETVESDNVEMSADGTFCGRPGILIILMLLSAAMIKLSEGGA